MVQNNAQTKAKNPGDAPAEKNNPLWGNPVVIFILSLVCALLTWLVVTMFFDPQSGIEITDATVNYGYNASTYTALGLDIVEQQDVGNVRVKVEGNGTIIGNITAADIMVYPSYSTVRNAGETTLGLAARIINTDYSTSGIKLTVENPTTVKIVFDTVDEKTVPVTPDTSAIAIADGYILNKVSPIPAEVTLHGPVSELDKVSEVVAPVTADGDLTDSLTQAAKLEMRDAEGIAVEPSYITMERENVDVTLSVYQVRELPLVVDFIDTPKIFDPASLSYSLSYATLRVAGPAKTISALTELSVSSFDLSKEFAFDRDYQRRIELPTGIVSQDGVESVTLSFDTTNMDVTTLNVSNIRTVNVPSNLNIEVLSSVVSNVKLYGPKNEINQLSAGNVLAQIDCQSIAVTAGQQTIPVTIQIPSSTNVFAVGNYTVQCEITAN